VNDGVDDEIVARERDTEKRRSLERRKSKNM
jgi:hypothetical protein